MTRPSLRLVAAAFLAGGAVAVGGVFLFGGHAAAAGPGGYGMMGGYGRGGPGTGAGPGMTGGRGWGGMRGRGALPGGAVQTGVTPADLAAVRDRVEKQLATAGYAGFRVAEVMAFANHDYVLVADAASHPAFELLAGPQGRWLMPEPPSMMWNTTYGMQRFLGGRAAGLPGMMRGYGAGSGGPVTTVTAAKARADAWLAQARPGERAADVTVLPGSYTVDVSRDGRTNGMLSVNAASGAVWFHAWHGAFLADRDF